MIIAQQQTEIEHYKSQLAAAQDQLRAKEQETQQTARLLVCTQTRLEEANRQHSADKEEVAAVSFMCGLLEQRVDECETQLSSQLMDHAEELAAKAQKFKMKLRTAQTERAEYERTANSLILQMNGQMEALQAMAMGRIEVIPPA